MHFETSGYLKGWSCANLFNLHCSTIIVTLILTSSKSASLSTSTPNSLPLNYSTKLHDFSSPEHQLHKILFAPGRYWKHVRPVTDHEHVIKVRLGMCSISINDIVEKDQTMLTSGCLKIKWNDELLRWNPEEYKNQSWLVVPSSEIWLPDIALTNSHDHYQITRKASLVEISSNGDVGYYPSGRFTSRCSIFLKYFPFDVQTCALFFESWIYPTDQVSIEPWEPEPINMKAFQLSQHWELETYDVHGRNRTSSDGLWFSEVTFRFYFRRRTLYYRILVILPCTLMSALQCFSHTLAVEHSGRMGLLTSIFLATFVLKSSVASQMPKSSEGITLIQIYQMVFSGTLVISILITMMNMHVWFRVPHRDKPDLFGLLWAFLVDTGKHVTHTVTHVEAAPIQVQQPTTNQQLVDPPEHQTKEERTGKGKKARLTIEDAIEEEMEIEDEITPFDDITNTKLKLDQIDGEEEKEVMLAIEEAVIHEEMVEEGETANSKPPEPDVQSISSTSSGSSTSSSTSSSSSSSNSSSSGSSTSSSGSNSSSSTNTETSKSNPKERISSGVPEAERPKGEKASEPSVSEVRPSISNNLVQDAGNTTLQASAESLQIPNLPDEQKLKEEKASEVNVRLPASSNLALDAQSQKTCANRDTSVQIRASLENQEPKEKKDSESRLPPSDLNKLPQNTESIPLQTSSNEERTSEQPVPEVPTSGSNNNDAQDTETAERGTANLDTQNVQEIDSAKDPEDSDIRKRKLTAKEKRKQKRLAKAQKKSSPKLETEPIVTNDEVQEQNLTDDKNDELENAPEKSSEPALVTNEFEKNGAKKGDSKRAGKKRSGRKSAKPAPPESPKPKTEGEDDDIPSQCSEPVLEGKVNKKEGKGRIASSKKKLPQPEGLKIETELEPIVNTDEQEKKGGKGEIVEIAPCAERKDDKAVARFQCPEPVPTVIVANELEGKIDKMGDVGSIAFIGRNNGGRRSSLKIQPKTEPAMEGNEHRRALNRARSRTPRRLSIVRFKHEPDPEPLPILPPKPVPAPTPDATSIKSVPYEIDELSMYSYMEHHHHHRHHSRHHHHPHHHYNPEAVPHGHDHMLAPQGSPVYPPGYVTYEERKERWLHFTMLIDKIFLYSIGTFNLLFPVILFGIVPEFQQYNTEDYYA